MHKILQVDSRNS